MKSVFYKASSRGHANHGWLDTHHTFSFANYYNPDRVHFGALRVVNDDIVEGGEGFGRHPHDNMEIVSIPLYGDLEHKDSMGHSGVIKAGEVQVMSAGTGVQHSEFNANPDKAVNFFQIWVFPNVQNAQPRYDQKSFDFLHNKNRLIQVVAPGKDGDHLWLNQDAWFQIGTFEKGVEVEYQLHNPQHGVFAMTIEGEFTVSGHELKQRDAVGIWETEKITLKASTADARILLIEIPMTV